MVSTIGRPVQMHRLLESLMQIEDPGVELIVVDQTDDAASARAAERPSTGAPPVRIASRKRI